MGSLINIVSGLSLSLNLSNLHGNNEALQDEWSIIKATPMVSVQTQANNLSSLAIKGDGVYLMYLRIGHRKDKPLCYVFIGFDTHSDEFTGILQHTGGHTGGTSTTITEILMVYLGEQFLSIIGQSSTVAKSNKTVVKTINRNGQRVLIMVICGPTIRVSHNFEAVKVLVESNLVDFVIVFREIGVFRSTDVWPAICKILVCSNNFLDYTMMVVVFASTVDNNRMAKCCQISKDLAETQAFEYKFKSCPTFKY
ncbi:hypothetical protein EV424DRAFT_1346478 [Suillus variegatus]|nr:hypothetical protein EV424DRAFT_1346478 [Suillus variegatus]